MRSRGRIGVILLCIIVADKTVSDAAKYQHESNHCYEDDTHGKSPARRYRWLNRRSGWSGEVWIVIRILACNCLAVWIVWRIARVRRRSRCWRVLPIRPIWIRIRARCRRIVWIGIIWVRTLSWRWSTIGCSLIVIGVWRVLAIGIVRVRRVLAHVFSLLDD